MAALPNNDEAERGLLGCCLESPEAASALLEAFPLDCEPFYDIRNQAIYESVLKLLTAVQPVDVLRVVSGAEKVRILAMGGVEYVASLPEATASPLNYPHYLKIVKEKWILRKLITECSFIIKQASEATGEIDGLLDSVEQRILAIAQSQSIKHEVDLRTALLEQVIPFIEARHAKKDGGWGISTGFPDLDKITYGLTDTEIFVIAARPSMGKSAILWSITENAARNNYPVAIFSAEMTTRSLALRGLCSHARINNRSIMSGDLIQRDFEKLISSSAALAKLPMYIDDTANIPVSLVRSRARRLKKKYGIRVVGVDYLQLLQYKGDHQMTREREVAQISSSLKAMGKELDVSVLALAQLNRQIEREKRKPNLSDLRESSAIEQDADVVGLLYRPNANEIDDGQDVWPVNLRIAKHRNGPTGEVNLTFLRNYCRFESAAKICAGDFPVHH